MSPKATFLSVVSSFLLIGLTWLPGLTVDGYSLTGFISELGALNMPSRSLANGAFFLIGAFWMGTVESVRKSLEPADMDPWIRFGVIAFAGSYIGSVIFPCDYGCPTIGSFNQIIHNTLIWALYAGGVFAGMRLQIASAKQAALILKAALVICFLATQLAAWQRHWWPGVWQRGYELSFVALWLMWIGELRRQARGGA